MTEKKPSPLDLVARRWFRDVFEAKPSTVPPVLYHYTDAAGLIGMLRSGKVWATDYRFLNDKSELAHTRSIARQLLTSQLSRTESNMLKAFYEAVLEYQAQDIQQSAFVFSLSEQADDLSQWRGYARDGQGFTIGFCGSSVYRTSEPDDAAFGFCQIEYSDKKQLSVLKQALSEMETELVAQVKDRPDDRTNIIEEAASLFDVIINNRATANKHGSFKSENEWRAIGIVQKKDEKGAVLVRSSGLRLVRYVELNLDSANIRLPIKRIGIGPGFTSTEEVHAVEALCKQTDYDAEIYFADTPYRRS